MESKSNLVSTIIADLPEETFMEIIEYIQRKCKHEKVSEIADALQEMSNICMQVELAK